jgi:hypothetical protein
MNGLSWSVLFFLLQACIPIQKKDSKIYLCNSSNFYNRVELQDRWRKPVKFYVLKHLTYSNSFFCKYSKNSQLYFNQFEKKDCSMCPKEETNGSVSTFSKGFMLNEPEEMQQKIPAVQLFSVRKIDNISKRGINHKNAQTKKSTKTKQRYRIKPKRTIGMD